MRFRAGQHFTQKGAPQPLEHCVCIERACTTTAGAIHTHDRHAPHDPVVTKSSWSPTQSYNPFSVTPLLHTQPGTHNEHGMASTYPHTLRGSLPPGSAGEDRRQDGRYKGALGTSCGPQQLRLGVSNVRHRFDPGWELRSHSSTAKKIKERDTWDASGSKRKIF